MAKRMEEYERRQRREREKIERQPVQPVMCEQSLFPEPRRVNPLHGDNEIEATLGRFGDFIKQDKSAVVPGILPTSAPNFIGGGIDATNGNAQTRQLPHHYQQQQQQSRQPAYLKQTDNKPPYNGRGGYPGQPVKNDVRASSGLAPPKGPPASVLPLHAPINAMNPPLTAHMPNGRHSSSVGEKSFLGPPAVPASLTAGSGNAMTTHANSTSSAVTHNGRFLQPQIPKARQKPTTAPIPNPAQTPHSNDIQQILNEVTDTYRAPEAPLTQIGATPHTTILENYNLNGPNKHKYAMDIPTPIGPLGSPPLKISSVVSSLGGFLTPITPISALTPITSIKSPPITNITPIIANANNTKENAIIALPQLKMEPTPVSPLLQKQNSTLENDLELSESDDDRKNANHSAINTSDSSQSDSSDDSEDSSKGEVHIPQQQKQQQQQLLLSTHHNHSSTSSSSSAATSHQPQQQQQQQQQQQTTSALLQRQLSNSSVNSNNNNNCAVPTPNISNPSNNKKKNLSQTITAAGVNTISSLLSNSGFNSTGNSSAPSSTSSSNNSNKTPSPSESKKWNLSNFFPKPQQTQNDASPNSSMVNVNSVNVSMSIPTMLPGGAQIIPEPTPQQRAAAAAASAQAPTIIKNEAADDDDDDDDDEDDEDDDEEDDDDDDDDENDNAANAQQTLAFGGRKPHDLSVTTMSPLNIKKEPEQLFKHLPATLLNNSDFVSVPKHHIKHEPTLSAGMTTMTPYSPPLPTKENKYLVELRKNTQEYTGNEVLASFSTNSSDGNDAMMPMPGPDGTLQIPGVPAAITALPRSPAAMQQMRMQETVVRPSKISNSTAAPVARKRRAKKKQQTPRSLHDGDTSEEENADCRNVAAAISPVLSAATATVNTVVVNNHNNKLPVDNMPNNLVTTKKARGRPRKTTSNQSSNLNSASSTTTNITNSLTVKGSNASAAAKKEAAKKPTARRRVSRQNSNSAASSSASNTQGNTPTKVNNNNNNNCLNKSLPVSTNASALQLTQKANSNATSEDSSSSSTSSSSSSKSSGSSSDSEADSGSASSSELEQQKPVPAARSGLSSTTTTGRRIVKQLNKRKSSLEETSTAAVPVATKKPLSSSASATDSDDFVPPPHGATEHMAYTTTSSCNRQSVPQQSPYKGANVHNHRVSASSYSSSSCSSASSSSGDDEQISNDANIAKHKSKKLRRDKPTSNKNQKQKTLTRIFNKQDGGAKKSGQVLIIDEMQPKESSSSSNGNQQQTPKHISPHTTAATNNFKCSQENLMSTSQSPRLTPGSIKSPRSLPPQLLLQRTPDRVSAIRTPTRTPTRTATPTQIRNAQAPTLICKIDLQRLKLKPEWRNNAFRLYMGGTPQYELEIFVNASADLQHSTATQLRLKRGGAGYATPRSTGSRTPASERERERERERTREHSRSRDSLLDAGKQQRLDEMQAGRFSSRSADGASTPKELSVTLPPPVPNGFTQRNSLLKTTGACSPSTKLLGSVKHELIKYEPDLDAAAAYEQKFKGVSVKQELIKAESEKQLDGLPKESKARRKRSSSASNSPHKEKKRKKDRERERDKDKNDKETLVVNNANDRLMTTDAVHKDKLREGNVNGILTTTTATTIMTTTMSLPKTATMPLTCDVTSLSVINTHKQKELDLLQQQLPPTNHDRLLFEKQQAQQLLKHAQLQSPAHFHNDIGNVNCNNNMTMSTTTMTATCDNGSLATEAMNNVNATATTVSPQQQKPLIVYRSLFEKDDDAFNYKFSNNEKLLSEAKNRKHAADSETNSFNQATLYLEAVVYFLLYGAALEQHGSHDEAVSTMYRDTFVLIKFISFKFRNPQVTNNMSKVTILSLRCQSLISLKLYKLRRNSCRTVINTCNEFFRSGRGEIVNGNTSSFISPSNSSSGSNTPPGKLVPPEVHSALNQENQLFCYLSNCHELWDQADQMIRQGCHTDFFISLDHENGPLTLHSSMHEVFRYVQSGLTKLKAAMALQ